MLKVSTSVKGSQGLKSALDDIKQRMQQQVKTVLVGVPKAAGEYEGGPHIATIAAVNNYGSADGRIPARPFLLPAFENGKDNYVKIAEMTLQDDALGQGAFATALERIGQKAAADVQEYMTNLQYPENADSTKARKGSSNPLIDTGALRSSITYQLTEPNEEIEEGLG